MVFYLQSKRAFARTQDYFSGHPWEGLKIKFPCFIFSLKTQRLTAVRFFDFKYSPLLKFYFMCLNVLPAFLPDVYYMHAWCLSRSEDTESPWQWSYRWLSLLVKLWEQKPSFPARATSALQRHLSTTPTPYSPRCNKFTNKQKQKDPAIIRHNIPQDLRFL